jgi:LemA protein
MSNQDQALARYIEKMYEIQYQQQEEVLTPAQLKQIALDMGISEQEWEASQQAFREALQNGKALAGQGHWQEAVPALEQATALQPYDFEAAYQHGRALVGRYRAQGSPADALQARDLLQRAVRLQPGHAGALQLLGSLGQEQQQQSAQQQQRKWIKFAAIGLVLSVLVLSFIGMRNTVASLDEGADRAWANVENAYQRRADLVPSLVNTVKGAAQHEQASLNKMLELQRSLAQSSIDAGDAKAFQQYHQQQQALGMAIQAVMAKAQGGGMATQAFRDLMTQLEGSENRIATERRKFNEAVQAYNEKVRQMPYSLLGYDKRPYFQIDRKAMEKPDVSF